MRSITYPALLLIVLVAPRAQATDDLIVDVPISISVRLSNTSAYSSPIACPATTTGDPATVHGHLIAPVSALLNKTRSVTLYIHGNFVNEDLFDFDPAPSVNMARKFAEQGHASIMIDRIGYGASTQPNGFSMCMGIEMDVDHQVVDAIRYGNYKALVSVPGIFKAELPGIRFQRIALATTSASGVTGVVNSVWYGGNDALIHMGWSDFGNNPDFFARTVSDLLTKCSISTDGYVTLANDIFAEAFTYNMASSIKNYLLANREHDPCGNIFTLFDVIPISQAAASQVRVPVFVIAGDHDAFFPVSAIQTQSAAFSGTSDRTTKIITNVGHDLLLNNNSAAVRNALHKWLSARGF